MNRRRFLSMLGAIPAALVVPSAVALAGAPLPVRTMTRTMWWALSRNNRFLWEVRILSYWSIPLRDIRQFWFTQDGGQYRVVGIERILRNAEGRAYAIGNEVATEILGRAS